MTRDEGLALLRGLGSSPDQVAARLAAAGIHGKLNDPTGCPVACFLHAQGAIAARVCPDSGISWQDSAGDNVVISYCETFRVISEFAMEFDALGFPTLITKRIDAVSP